jgi:hypothetical protein
MAKSSKKRKILGANKKTKKKKRVRYHTGIHESIKITNGGRMKYRSGWEQEVAIFLDNNEKVLSYYYEGLIIPYISNIKTGKKRNYFPDFLVKLSDGTELLIEVKRGDKVASPIVIKKSQAARAWCDYQERVNSRKITFVLWTNQIIEQIKKINLTNQQNKLKNKLWLVNNNQHQEILEPTLLQDREQTIQELLQILG